LLAHALLTEKTMNIVCRHCDELIIGSAYRVTSEEDGVPLLDMIVCGACAFQAKCLDLHTEEMTAEHIEAPAFTTDSESDRLPSQFN
jgi:RNase P subunit RPR2